MFILLALPTFNLADFIQPLAINVKDSVFMGSNVTDSQVASLPEGFQGLARDWSSDKEAFHIPWGKAMMWFFLLSDTFIFGCFLTSYMNVRMSTRVPWPNPSEVFALSFGGEPIPLVLIALMTFVLITSSGTMALAVNYGYRRDRAKTAALMFITAAFGATFVGMQAFEWTKLIVDEGIRPWGNPMGAPQFGASFFMITGFHGAHVSIGVIYLAVVALKVLKGDYEASGNYEVVEITGLYWHFVDLVWVFIFAFFYLW
jgi:cytochrome c oxidase subunit 3